MSDLPDYVYPHDRCEDIRREYCRRVDISRRQLQESLGRQFENLDAHDACHFLLYTEVTLAKIVDKPEEAEAILKERGILQ